MAKEKYLLEITDFPTKGITSKFDIKDYGFIHDPANQNEIMPRWDKSFYGYEWRFGIVRAMDEYSTLFYALSKHRGMQYDPGQDFGYGDEISNQNPLSKKFPQMTFSLITPNSRIDYDFVEVNVMRFSGHSNKGRYGVPCEEIEFFFIKFKNFMLTVDKTTSPS